MMQQIVACFHYNMALGDLGTLIFHQGWWYFQVVIYLVGRAPPRVGQSPTQSDFIEEGTFPKIHQHLSTQCSLMAAFQNHSSLEPTEQRLP